VRRVASRGGAVSPTSVRRFAARSRSRRWLALRPVLAALTVLAVLAGAAWVALASDLLAVRTVEVSGAQRLSTEQVLAAADVEMGRPLVLTDTEAIGARVTEALPPARDASVRRAWPTGLRIEVAERVAAAVLPAAAGVHLVDAEGVVFATQRQAPAGVPVIDAAPGAGQDTLRAAVAVVTALPPDIAEMVTAVTARTPHAVELALTGDRIVVWGGAERSQRKAVVLSALMSQPATVYDVSAPDAPTTRS
jgi:cell division septal protein FtsQ